MKDKIVVVTGSTRGLGFALAEAMLRAGATVIVTGRSRAAVQRAVKYLQHLGPVEGLACDVRRERQVYALARRVVRMHGHIDVWINNAGYSSAAGRIIDTPPAQAVDMFMANDMGVLFGTRAALNFMLKRHSGTLVNVYGAGSFLRPASPTALYGATKAWVASFTRSLATELAGSGVQVVGFSPGMLLTDMLTAPVVLGKPGRDMMRRYGFVLRMLGGSPQRAAERLVRLLESDSRPFLEYRLFKPWTPLIGMLRIGWENLTGTGSRPKFTLRVVSPYRPRL